MKFTNLTEKRDSVQAYKANPVRNDQLSQVLEATRQAPIPNNRQPFLVAVIRTPDNKSALQHIYNQDWFVQAPLVMCACAIAANAQVQTGDGKNYGSVEIATVLDHLTQAAANEGLGTCWIHDFNVQATRQLLDLPKEVIPVAFSPLGYPADRAKPKEGKPLSELVRYEN